MKGARRSYKRLWQAERAAFQHAKDRADYFERELGRIKALLVPFGESVLKEKDAQPSDSQTIRLFPLEYEASKAFIESHALVSQGFYDESALRGATFYTWRGRPLLQVAS